MGRKPYKKIHLTNAESKVVDKIAHWTRVDESWFSLADRSDNETAVRDKERRYWITLQFGQKLLSESFGGKTDEDYVRLGVLTRKEVAVWRKIKAKVWKKVFEK